MEKENIEESDQRIISFDFDSTLQIPVIDADGDEVGHVPNPEMISKVFEHHELGHKVIIVTTRLDKFMDEVHQFVKDNDLPIAPEDIHNTNMTWKRNTLRRLKVNVHFDDNPDELRRIRHAPNILGRLVEAEPIKESGENDE